MTNLTAIARDDSRSINGGARYYACPFCNSYVSTYWNTYAHALKCSYFNSKVFRYGWTTAIWMLKKGLGL